MGRFLKKYARANFANATIHERVFFAWLKERDKHWVAQHVWGHSIMDCWHSKNRVCIEIDGDDHRYGKRKEKDKKRDRAMMASGILVFRVTNKQVDTGEAHCMVSELMGYEWRSEDFYRPLWVSPYL